MAKVQRPYVIAAAFGDKETIVSPNGDGIEIRQRVEVEEAVDDTSTVPELLEAVNRGYAGERTYMIDRIYLSREEAASLIGVLHELLATPPTAQPKTKTKKGA